MDNTTHTAPNAAAKCTAYRTATSWTVWERGTDKCACGRQLKLRKHPVRDSQNATDTD